MVPVPPIIMPFRYAEDFNRVIRIYLTNIPKPIRGRLLNVNRDTRQKEEVEMTLSARQPRKRPRISPISPIELMDSQTHRGFEIICHHHRVSLLSMAHPSSSLVMNAMINITGQIYRMAYLPLGRCRLTVLSDIVAHSWPLNDKEFYCSDALGLFKDVDIGIFEMGFTIIGY